jgi:hypothetical protein
MTQDTSREAFLDLPLADLGIWLMVLLEENGSLTDQEAAQLMHKAASTVSGVRRPLVKRGKIVEGGKRECRITGRTVISWKLAGPAVEPPITIDMTPKPCDCPTAEIMAGLIPSAIRKSATQQPTLFAR